MLAHLFERSSMSKHDVYWNDRRVGEWDYSHCKPVREEFDWTLPNGDTFHIRQRDDGYIVSEPFRLESVQRGGETSLAEIARVLLPRGTNITLDMCQADQRYIDGDYDEDEMASILQDEAGNELEAQRSQLISLMNEQILVNGKVSIKALVRKVELLRGKEYVKNYIGESQLGSVSGAAESLMRKDMVLWVTPILDLHTTHYANHRSCWWGEQGREEVGRRKCFNRCSFKAAGGFAILGVFASKDKDVEFGFDTKTDLRILVYPMYSKEIGNIGANDALFFFNEYDKLSLEGWVTEKGVSRTRWCADLLAKQFGYRTHIQSVSYEFGARDGHFRKEFEVNSDQGVVLYTNESNYSTRRVHPYGQTQCDCRTKYLRSIGREADALEEEYLRGIRPRPTPPPESAFEFETFWTTAVLEGRAPHVDSINSVGRSNPLLGSSRRRRVTYALNFLYNIYVTPFRLQLGRLDITPGLVDEESSEIWLRTLTLLDSIRGKVNMQHTRLNQSLTNRRAAQSIVNNRFRVYRTPLSKAIVECIFAYIECRLRDLELLRGAPITVLPTEYSGREWEEMRQIDDNMYAVNSMLGHNMSDLTDTTTVVACQQLLEQYWAYRDAVARLRRKHIADQETASMQVRGQQPTVGYVTVTNTSTSSINGIASYSSYAILDQVRQASEQTARQVNAQSLRDALTELQEQAGRQQQQAANNPQVRMLLSDLTREDIQRIENALREAITPAPNAEEADGDNG